jgi:hypothetical protein
VVTSKILIILIDYPSRMTGKSKAVNTHSHKYYPISQKSLKSITSATVITTINIAAIIPQIPRQDMIANNPSYESRLRLSIRVFSDYISVKII